MKHVLVLGAGMVSKPLETYLLNQPDYYVKMASRTLSKAERIIGGHDRGNAEELNVSDFAKLERLISESDITVSLLPYEYQIRDSNNLIDKPQKLMSENISGKGIAVLNPTQVLTESKFDSKKILK